MKTFLKKEENFDVLKLYKVFSANNNHKFDLKECLKFCENFFEEFLEVKPNLYDLNYGFKTWKSYKNYRKTIENIKVRDFSNLTIYELSSESMFSFSNNTFDSKEKTSYIEIIIAINKPLIKNLIKETSFLEKLVNYYDFNYGYGLFIDKTFDFISERKIKKSFFSFFNSSSVSNKDIAWCQNISKLKQGFIKKIYPFNLLNSSQMASNSISQLVDKKIGETINLNDEMVIWFIKDDNCH